MSKLINAQEKQIRDLKGERGKLELVILDLKQKKFDSSFKPKMHETNAKNTEMLDELNGLLDQNQRLVKELDEQRTQVKKLKESKGTGASLPDETRIYT